jgi:hypothetical protein
MLFFGLIQGGLTVGELSVATDELASGRHGNSVI